MSLKDYVSRSVARLRAAPTWITSSFTAQLWLRDCDKVGSNTRTFWRPNIENRGHIFIGDRVRLNSNWAPVELVSGPNGIIEIGDGVFINYGSNDFGSSARSNRIQRDDWKLLHHR